MWLWLWLWEIIYIHIHLVMSAGKASLLKGYMAPASAGTTHYRSFQCRILYCSSGIQYCQNPQELTPCNTAVPTKAGTMHYRWNSHEGKPSAAAVAASTGTIYACMQHCRHPQVLEPCSIAGTHQILKTFSTGNPHKYWSHSLLPVPTSVGTMHYYQPHKY